MRHLAAALLAVAGLFGARGSAAEPVAHFDYLYIRAHEGNASGGHAAIRFGAATFDFQHDGGWLAPRREDSRRFQHAYRTLQNRGIEVSRIAAAPETVRLLRETFERRLQNESRQLALLGELERDAALLAALADGGAAAVDVRGAGFFAEGAGGDAPAALVELRDRVAARWGSGWLAQRRNAAERALRDVLPVPLDASALAAAPLDYPVARSSPSRRTAQSLAARAASAAIQRPRALRAGARAGEALAPDPTLVLDAPARQRLLAWRAALLDRAAALAASRRPDWGEAMLLASARLAALDESLARGHLVVLDAFPAGARVVPITERRRAVLPALLAEAQEDLARALARGFADSAHRETAWSALEEHGTRVAELRAALAGAAQMRVFAGSMMPEGVAAIAVAPRPAATPVALAPAARAARGAAGDYRRALAAQYRYDLLTRNCVSELFRTVEAALASGADAPAGADRDAIRDFVQRESRLRLGGYVDPTAAANFIPFVSSHNVRSQWEVAERIHLPSLREYVVTRDGTLRAALRESNVVTSTLALPAARSGFFVFYTDGSWPLRPLLGAVNLGAALARSGVGILQLPLDRGRGLRAGLEGAVWSVPELFFANIRKGGREYVPPELQPPPG